MFPPASVETKKVEGQFVDPTSVIHPVIRFHWTGVNPSAYTYAKIFEFGNRSYFIEDWTFTSEGWVATMELDALGTFKQYIGDSVQYLIRSTNRADHTIVDAAYPTTTRMKSKMLNVLDENNVPVNAWPQIGFDKGCFIIGVSGYEDANIGCVQYFGFLPSQFSNFVNYMFSNPSWLDLDAAEIGQSIARAVVNPTDYITSCRWYPFTLAMVDCTFVNYFHMGWWRVNQSAYIINNPLTPGHEVSKSNMHVDIDPHPQSDPRTYLNAPPYTTRSLFYPPFGEIPIPYELTNGATRIDINTQVDITSGIVSLHMTNNAYPFYIAPDVYAQIGVDIPLSQAQAMSMGKVAGGLAGIIGIVGAALTGGASAALTAAGTSAAGIGAASALEQPRQSPAAQARGTFLSLTETPRLITNYLYVTGGNEWSIGYPCCKRVKIDTGNIALGGNFYQCDRASVKIPGSSAEREIIENYMNEGFYYE